jgi:hypothetical protein
VASEACLNFLGSRTIIHGNTSLNMLWYYVQLYKLVLNVISNHGGRYSRQEKAFVSLQVSPSLFFSKLTASRCVTEGMCS